MVTYQIAVSLEYRRYGLYVAVVVVGTLGCRDCQSPRLSVFPLGTALPAIGLRSS